MAVNLLLSYAFHQSTDLAKVKAELVCGRLMVDSGAFTAHSTGKAISREAYAAWLERWQGQWDQAVTLDVIGDPVATAANTRWLHARGLPVMPVFTLHGKAVEFEAMVKDCRYVCCGGTVGLPKPVVTRRHQALQARALTLGGGIHTLGVGALAALRAIRPYSADASSLSNAFKYGNLVFFDGQTMRTMHSSKRARLRQLAPLLAAHGIDVGGIYRAGDLPTYTTPAGSVHRSTRHTLMQAMALAYAAADEHLKATHLVPPPQGLEAYGPGTHLFNSTITDLGLPSARADRALHDPTTPTPALWRNWAGQHAKGCRAPAPAHTAAV